MLLSASIKGLGAGAALIAALASPAQAELYLVADQAAFRAAAEKVEAGDEIVLADGIWRDFEIALGGNGTADQPITLRPQTPGRVILSGQSNLRIGGRHIHVTGLVFRDGYSPTGDVIAFRRSAEDVANASQVSEVVIEGFSKPGRYDDDYWVSLYGRDNRFDHNALIGKTNKGVTLAVRLDGEQNQRNGHRIDHNYFGPRPILGSNGGETLRIGTSHFADAASNTVVEDNYFERCDGEVEIISIKSGGNIVRGNVFDASRGALTLRHGDGNLVERNVFLGRGKDHTGGIRVINRDQTVRGNYMEGLRGTGFASALTVMNGVPDSPPDRYVQVANATIERNTILDSTRITFGAGRSEERSAPPVDSRFIGNLLGGHGDGPFLEVEDDPSGIASSGNRIVAGAVADGMTGVTRTTATLLRGANGLLTPDKGPADVGAPRDLTVLTRDATGPAWYAKPALSGAFDSGEVVPVSPGENTLSDALASAGPGARLQLAAGRYTVDRTLIVDRTLSVLGPADGAGTATLSFARPTLFELAGGGNLKLSAPHRQRRGRARQCWQQRHPHVVGRAAGQFRAGAGPRRGDRPVSEQKASM